MTPTRRITFPTRWLSPSRHAAAAATALWLCSVIVSAQAPTVAVLYQRAMDRETTLRASATMADDDLQRTIAAYENVVRKFPNSSYSDNALWQASGLALLSYNKTHADTDRMTGERLVKWLTSEYPSSPFVGQSAERLRAFGTPAASSAKSSAASSSKTAAPTAPTNAPASRAMLRGIKREPLPAGDRIVIDLDREVSFLSDRIAGPDRVFLDLPSTAVGDGVPAAAAAVKGMLISAVRLGHPSAGMTRVVIDLAGAPKHSIYPLYSPYRLVIDAEGAPQPALTKTQLPPEQPTVAAESAAPIASPAPAVAVPASMPVAPVPSPLVVAPVSAPPVATAPLLAAAPVALKNVPVPPPPTAAPPASTSRKGDYSLARQLGLGVQRIVIDAGHGGHDPGAHGNGITEKELVLDVALRLQALLKDDPSVEVVLTRDTDDFIALEERTAIANRSGADLFLSIHANASTRPDARGLETYFLNFATTKDAEAVAARENAASTQNMGHLPDMLKAIALNNKLAESRELATMVQSSMVKKMKTQNTTVRDLGVKQAPFVVLIGAEMPSVLAEISFLTNKADATSLKQDATKQKIAQALYDGIVKYQSSLKKANSVASKGSKQ